MAGNWSTSSSGGTQRSSTKASLGTCGYPGQLDTLQACHLDSSERLVVTCKTSWKRLSVVLRARFTAAGAVKSVTESSSLALATRSLIMVRCRDECPSDAASRSAGGLRLLCHRKLPTTTSDISPSPLRLTSGFMSSGCPWSHCQVVPNVTAELVRLTQTMHLPRPISKGRRRLKRDKKAQKGREGSNRMCQGNTRPHRPREPICSLLEGHLPSFVPSESTFVSLLSQLSMPRVNCMVNLWFLNSTLAVQEG